MRQFTQKLTSQTTYLFVFAITGFFETKELDKDIMGIISFGIYFAMINRT